MNKKRVLLLLTIILGLGITLGTIYFMYYQRIEKVNKLTTGLITLTFSENASSTITLNNEKPILDEEGLQKTPYEFTITNTSQVPVDVNIKLNIKNSTTFTNNELSAVRYGLYINDELVKKDYVHYDNLTLYTHEELSANGTIQCKLKFWIDYYYDTPGKIFTASIQAEGQNSEIIPVTITLNPNYENASNNTIAIDKSSTTYGTLPEPTRDGYTFTGWYTTADDTGTKIESTTPFTYGTSQTTLYAHWEESNAGCPGEGCYYSSNSYGYTTWRTGSQTIKTIDPETLPSGVSTNYQDVVQYNTFIAMRLNGNNQVEHAYACGIENNTPFCIEGTYDASPDKTAIQTSNLAILTPVFGSCSGAVGSDISCSGSLVAGSNSDGSVKVLSGGFYCNVSDDGFFGWGTGGASK